MHKMIATAIACLALVGIAPTTGAQSSDKRYIQIPAQQLGRALQTLAKDRGFQVLYVSEEINKHQTEGASGELTSEEALRKLLAGTGLTFRYLGENSVTIIPMSEASSAAGSPASATSDPQNPIRWAHSSSMQKIEGAAGAAATNQQREDAPGQADQSLQEIVVTAQKRSERLQDIPVPVTAIRGETLTNTHQLRIEDYYKQIPGLALAVRGNGNSPAISIRGVTTGGDANPTVGIVVDDVAYGASVVTGPNLITAADIDPGDLARIEVLRGPQGTLYGAASMGGLLKFVTVDPSTERLYGRIQTGATSIRHSDDLGYSVRGNINVPLGDTFAVRASGFTLRDPGYIDNVETGQRDVNRRDSEGGRISALWRPSDAFSLKLSALIQSTERLGTSDVDSALGVENFQQSFLRGTGGYSRDTQAYSATMVAQLGSLELTSATGYSTDELTDSVDTTALWTGFPEFLFPVLAPGRAITATRNEVKKFTQEIRGVMPLTERLNWLIGGFYTDERAYINADNQAAFDSGESVGSMLSNNYDPGKFEERALFTNLTIDLTERWDVQLGGRYSQSKQDLQLVIDGAYYGGPIPQNQAKAEDSAFTYLITPRVKLSPNVMAYARLASGYRPGGPNAGCGVPSLPCKFDADTTQNYEVGVKGSTSERRMSYEASLYYIDWKDIQISDIQVPGSGGFFYTGNASRAKSQGVELSLELRPLTGMTLASWVAYNEAELTEGFAASGVVGAPGDRLPNSSRISGNISVEQEFSPWDSVGLFVGGSLSYVGERFGKFRDTGQARQAFPAYAQIDVHSGLRFESWEVNLFVNNVADRRGVLRGGADALFIPTYFNYIRPRTLGLSLVKTFD